MIISSRNYKLVSTAEVMGQGGKAIDFQEHDMKVKLN